MKNLLLETLTIKSEILNSVYSQIYFRLDPIVKKIVERQREAKGFVNFGAESRFKRDVTYSLTFDLFKCVSGYLTDSDSIKINTVSTNAKGFNIDATVTRNGNEFYFNTSLIFAGGYNIQCAHYRYIVDTPLRSLNSNIAETTRKNVNKFETAMQKIKDLQNDLASYKIMKYEALAVGKTNGYFNKDIRSVEKRILAHEAKVEEMIKAGF